MVSIEFDPKLFGVDTIKRAAYRLADRATFEFALSDKALTVIVSPASSEADLQAVVVDLHREVLDQDLRDRLSAETQQIRTLILASAFSNTPFGGG